MDNLKKELFKKLDILEAKNNSKPEIVYQLSFLRKCLDKTFVFSYKCTECKLKIRKIDKVVDNLIQELEPNVYKNVLREYENELEDVIIHLREKHKLVTKGHYISLCMAMGIALGIVIGIFVEDFGIGFALGILLGLSTGSILESKSKKKGQTI